MTTLLSIYKTLAALVHPSTDSELLTDACWALSFLTDGPHERIQALIDTNVTRRLVDLLSGERAVALSPALRTIANLVTGDDVQTQAVINCGALLQLQKILANSHLHPANVVREACWALSNIAAGTKGQVDALIASGAVQQIVRLLVDGDLNTKREAVWAVSNASSSSDVQQCDHLVQLGCLRPLSQLLSGMDTCIVLVALEGIQNVLVAGQRLGASGDAVAEERNLYAYELESAGGLDELEALQNHSSQEVCNKAVDILTTFFVVLEEENTAPQLLDTTGNYAFPAAAASGTHVSFAGL
jgi:importin subunit alpha-6/7